MQLRRHARERREYIYRKNLESQEQQIYERKQKLKDSLATGKLFPTELRKESQKLAKDLPFDESQEGARRISPRPRHPLSVALSTPQPIRR